MTDGPNFTPHIVDHIKLPKHFPTHRHAPLFWENLGRTVATFGYLEEILGKAIFCFTSTQIASDEDINNNCKKFLQTLESALKNPLGNLIKAYKKSVCEHQNITIDNFEVLLTDLRQVSEIRNVLCHGSWRAPDSQGCSVPFFVDQNKRLFESPIDVEYLKILQQQVAIIACDVVRTVTIQGWRFPGSSGPGNPVH